MAPTEWTTIRVPREVHAQIQKLSQKFNMPAWKVVAWGLSFITEHLKNAKAKEELPAADKAAWYAVKVAMTVGAFRENPSERKLKEVQRVLMQLRNRYGIDTDALWLAVLEYYNIAREVGKDEVPDDVKIELTTQLKIVVLEIFEKLLFEEKTG